MYVLAHLLSTLLLLFALWATGGVLVARLGGGVLERFAYGCLVVTGLLFLLAACGLYRPLVISLLVPLAAVVGLLAARSKFAVDLPGGDAVAASDDQDPDAGAGSSSRWILIVSLVLCCVALLIEALKPTISWDADVYHLAVPKLYLEHGGFFRIPFNVYSNWPLNIELLYGVALLRAPAVAKTLHFAFGLGAAGVAYRLARSQDEGRRSAFCGTVAMVLFLGNPVVLRQIATAYVDCAYAFFFPLAALLLLELIERSPEDPMGIEARRIVLSVGLLAGMVAGIKLNGFFAALCLSLLALVGVARSRIRSAATIAMVSFVMVLPWLVKSWLLTGNPVYPLFYGLFGGPEWSQVLAEKHAAWQSSIGMGRSVLDYLLLPARVVLYGGEGYLNFDGALSPAWMSLLPLSLFGAVRDRRTRLLLLVVALYFVLWALTSQQMRFLIPVLPLLAAAAARSSIELFELVTRTLSTDLRRRVLVLLHFVLATSLSGQLIAESWPLFRQAPRIARDLVTLGPELDVRVTHPVYRFMNENLPVDARVLMINHNRGFALERPYIADSFFEASQVQEALGWQTTRAEVEATLDELGVTHLLVENRDLGLRFAQPLVDLLSDEASARVLYQSPDGRYSVIELLDSPAAEPLDRQARLERSPERCHAACR